MRLRLFLLLASSLLAGIGTAHASCTNMTLFFPPPGNPTLKVISGSCITDPNSGARLRWDDNNNGELQLFDTDGVGALLWCAHDSTGACAKGSSLCLQADGNLVIYAGSDCRTDPLWASNTFGIDPRTHQPFNDDGEILVVGDVSVNGGKRGERAVILNDQNPGAASDSNTIIWLSNNTD